MMYISLFVHIFQYQVKPHTILTLLNGPKVLSSASVVTKLYSEVSFKIYMSWATLYVHSLQELI